MNSLTLAQQLISFKTITPETGESLEFMENLLKSLGLNVIIKKFEDIDASSKPTYNIYAYLNKNAKKNLTFLGHLDVVHSGHESDWTYPPFEPLIENGILYGRGASDMKSTIVCFCVALQNIIGKIPKDDSISILLTYDEEGNAINGTKKMLQFLKSDGFTFSDAITGEPTSSKQIGDTIKIGRRGSVNFVIEIIGKQGHVAYPELAKNPVYEASSLITSLKNYEFDKGNKNFQPTNLEITGVETSTKETGLIPNSVKIMCNIRFNDEHTSTQVIEIVEKIIKENIKLCSYKVKNKVSGESFILKNDELAKKMSDAIYEITGRKAELSTSGGTSDARFMKDYANVIEFGVLNETAHKIDECVPVEHIEIVTQIYQKFIENYFEL